MNELQSASGSANSTPSWLNVLNGVTSTAGNVASLFKREQPQPSQVVIKQVAEEKIAADLKASPVMTRERWLWVALAGVGLVGLLFFASRR